ncbi:MAG TPA: 50S ribosomal protein L11 methyltransferase [Alphaproteobacteria bacterium]|nr:50S ribosomal protein L11 methyltransferase [Alphaproteobacteria bacterium]
MSQWLVELIVPDHAVAIFQNAVEPFAEAVTAFEVPGTTLWRVAAYAEAAPERGALEAALAVAALGTGVAVPAISVGALPDRDWLAENRRNLPPLVVGRWYIHGSHVAAPAPAGATPLRIDAGLAFGAGSHESTRGCLLALDRLARRRRFHRPLDLGCGSGILALAMARRWHVPVLAVDVDLVAVRTTRRNAEANGVARHVHVMVGDRVPPRDVVVHRGGHDLIMANILARPLIGLAPTIARALAPGGTVVLSGILRTQQDAVIAAYRAQGLALRDRVTVGDWPTLIMARRPGGRRGQS